MNSFNLIVLMFGMMVTNSQASFNESSNSSPGATQSSLNISAYASQSHQVDHLVPMDLQTDCERVASILRDVPSNKLPLRMYTLAEQTDGVSESERSLKRAKKQIVVGMLDVIGFGSLDLNLQCYVLSYVSPKDALSVYEVCKAFQRTILTRGHIRLKVNGFEYNIPNEDLITILDPYDGGLRHFDAGEVNINDACVGSLANKCKELEFLKLSADSDGYVGYSVDGFKFISQNCHNLTFLDFANVPINLENFGKLLKLETVTYTSLLDDRESIASVLNSFINIPNLKNLTLIALDLMIELCHDIELINLGSSAIETLEFIDLDAVIEEHDKVIYLLQVLPTLKMKMKKLEVKSCLLRSKYSFC